MMSEWCRETCLKKKLRIIIIIKVDIEKKDFIHSLQYHKEEFGWLVESLKCRFNFYARKNLLMIRIFQN